MENKSMEALANQSTLLHCIVWREPIAGSYKSVS